MTKMISLDNGLSYQTAKTITTDTLVENWDVIVFYMDDEIREQVVAEVDCPEGRREFLHRYLELASSDLVIG